MKKKIPEVSDAVMRQDENTADAAITGLQDIEFDCSNCKHLYKDGVTCKAFPDVIPSKIWHGDFIHNKPYPGDNGIMFEKAKKLRMTL